MNINTYAEFVNESSKHMKHFKTFTAFVNESLNEGKYITTKEILKISKKAADMVPDAKYDLEDLAVAYGDKIPLTRVKDILDNYDMSDLLESVNEGKESDLKKEPITDELSLESSSDAWYYAQVSGPPEKADYIGFISSMASLPERLKMGLGLCYDGAIPRDRLSGFLSTLSDMSGKHPSKPGRSLRLTTKTIHGMLKAHDNAEDAYEEFAEVYK